MRLITSLFAFGLIAFAPIAEAQQRADEQGLARREMRAGNVRSLREIEERVLPSMSGMQYLGPEYDPIAMAYRLKFIRDGRVVFIDIDARTGQIRR
ncbi:PepSY domain-containing protein [Novosphingobium sp. Chol11]|uniref:PepSY domain-containing protein n=1 Tax=Novosphingobium sp. Chol11 TaxID=1385763 RepID=UPI0025E256F3|nr:PepSY domain-containing protein [Novosphingobium sp. Chol11]